MSFTKLLTKPPFTEAWAYKKLNLVDPDTWAQIYALDMFNEKSRPGITTRMCINAALALLNGQAIQIPHSLRVSILVPRPNLTETTLLFALRLCPRNIKGICKHPIKELYALRWAAKNNPNLVLRMSYAPSVSVPTRFEDHAYTGLYDNLAKNYLRSKQHV